MTRHDNSTQNSTPRITHAPFSRLKLVALGAIALLLAACTSSSANSTGAAAIPGESGEEITIAISGAFALFPMVTIWAEQYGETHPHIRFDIQAGGAGKGMTDVLAGAVDIAMVSRDARAEELERGAFMTPVTIDAVIGTFNAANPYSDEILRQGITAQEVGAIWLTGEITTWGELLGIDAPEEINVYTRSDSAGAAEMWAFFGGGKAQEELLGIAVNADPGLAEAVRQDPLGVGFNNIGFAYDPTTLEPIAGLQVFPIDLDADGVIGEDEDFYTTRDALAQAIAAGAYPSPPARVLYLVTRGEPPPAIKDFYYWILTEGQAYVADAGYVQLTQERLDEALSLIGD